MLGLERIELIVRSYTSQHNIWLFWERGEMLVIWMMAIWCAIEINMSTKMVKVLAKKGMRLILYNCIQDKFDYEHDEMCGSRWFIPSCGVQGAEGLRVVQLTHMSKVDDNFLKTSLKFHVEVQWKNMIRDLG